MSVTSKTSIELTPPINTNKQTTDETNAADNAGNADNDSISEDDNESTEEIAESIRQGTLSNIIRTLLVEFFSRPCQLVFHTKCTITHHIVELQLVQYSSCLVYNPLLFGRCHFFIRHMSPICISNTSS